MLDRQSKRGGPRPGAGRPLTAGTPRRIVLKVQADEASAAEIHAAATAANQTVATFLLEAGLQRARRQRR